MNAISRFVTAAVAVALTVQPVPARADQTTGQLVYAFTYDSRQNVTARDSTNNAEAVGESGTLTGGTNGISHYGGTLADKGTMTVEIVGKQQDGGLAVNISEAGENVRRASPATCVVYGNTNVICDPNKTIYTEEYTLLRFLGPNFVDATQLDANRHWKLMQSSPDMTVKADYAINANNNGVMQIAEARKIQQSGAGKLTTDIQTKIGYDTNRSVPTLVDEYARQYTDSGLTGTSTTTYQTTLQLVSDSVAAKP